MDLSIIVINYKTKKVTTNCLKSIKSSTDNLKKEVIVVDNGSKDGSLESLKQKFPEFKVVSSGGNLGFAQGNNLAAKLARGKYLWLLNSDTLLSKTTIQTLFDLAKTHHTQIGSCRLLNKDKSIQPQGGFLPNIPRLFAWMLFIDDLPFFNLLFKPYQQRNINFYKSDQHPGWLGGTALLVKRDLYNKMGGLDKKIFMYGEDVDFCLRAKKLNLELDYFTKPSVIHLGQASGSSKGAILGEYKGLKYIFKKHYSPFKHITLRLLLKLGALLRIIIFGVILKDKTKKEIYEQAFKLA